MENDYQIMLARPEHLASLPQIERAADYHGSYEPTEWDTGKPTGKEIW